MQILIAIRCGRKRQRRVWREWVRDIRRRGKRERSAKKRRGDKGEGGREGEIEISAGKRGREGEKERSREREREWGFGADQRNAPDGTQATKYAAPIKVPLQTVE